MRGVGSREALTAVAASRYLAAVLLGLLGLLLNRVVLELVPGVGPEFLLGGATPLLAGAWLGPLPALLAAVVALLERLLRAELLGLATLVYVLEAVAAVALSRRLRSLALSAVAFWLLAGWAFDLVVYWRLMALPRDYVALLFTKQVLNATLNGLVADVAIMLAPRLSRRGRPPAPMRTYTFDRVAIHVLGAALAVGLFVTRWSYDSRLEALRSRGRQVAREVAQSVSGILRTRAESLATLARLVEIDKARGRRSSFDHLEAFVAEYPEVLNVGVVDPDGWLVDMRPRTNARGERIDARRSLAHREYFRVAKATRRTAYAPLILGDLHVRMTRGAEPVVIVAEPLLGEAGEFAGVVFAAVDAAFLRASLARHADAGEAVTLTDTRRTVIASLDERLRPGMPLARLVPAVDVAADGERLFRYVPPPSGTARRATGSRSGRPRGSRPSRRAGACSSTARGSRSTPRRPAPAS